MNRFFQSAMRTATGMAGRPSRLLSLVSRLALKLRETNWSNLNATAAQERIFVLGRLIKAYALGQYRAIPWKTILLIVAAVVYFVNPLDLVPDIIPLTGLTDDFAVLLEDVDGVGDLLQTPREHDDVGGVLRRGRDEAVGLEEAGDALGVVLVHLAPEGAHQVALRHAAQVRGGRDGWTKLRTGRGRTRATASAGRSAEAVAGAHRGRWCRHPTGQPQGKPVRWGTGAVGVSANVSWASPTGEVPKVGEKFYLRGFAGLMLAAWLLNEGLRAEGIEGPHSRGSDEDHVPREGCGSFEPKSAPADESHAADRENRTDPTGGASLGRRAPHDQQKEGDQGEHEAGVSCTGAVEPIDEQHLIGDDADEAEEEDAAEDPAATDAVDGDDEAGGMPPLPHEVLGSADVQPDEDGMMPALPHESDDEAESDTKAGTSADQHDATVRRPRPNLKVIK